MIISKWHCGFPGDGERCTEDKPGHLASPTSKRRTASLYCYGSEIAVRCDHEGCTNEIEIKTSLHWTMVNAGSKEGWFFRKDGTGDLCFDHLTVGLIAWRDRNNPGWRGRLKRGLAERLPAVEVARRAAELARRGSALT